MIIKINRATPQNIGTQVSDADFGSFFNLSFKIETYTNGQMINQYAMNIKQVIAGKAMQRKGRDRSLCGIYLEFLIALHFIEESSPMMAKLHC